MRDALWRVGAGHDLVGGAKGGATTSLSAQYKPPPTGTNGFPPHREPPSPHLGHRLLAVLLEALEAVHRQRLAARHAHAALHGAVLSFLLSRLHIRLALVRPDCGTVGVGWRRGGER